MDFEAMRKVLEALERGGTRGPVPFPAQAPMGLDSAELHREIERAWSLARAAGLFFPPGVYRHRTVEEMNRQTEAWSEANAERLRALLSDSSAVDGR